MNLYHISGWQHLKSVQVGETFLLRPGTQNAEGLGVYFSEGAPRAQSCAEGTREHGVSGVVVIDAALNDTSWYRSKGAKARKTGKARTWHTNGKNIECRVEKIEDKILHCVWQLAV